MKKKGEFSSPIVYTGKKKKKSDVYLLKEAKDM